VLVVSFVFFVAQEGHWHWAGVFFWWEAWSDHPVYRKSKCWKRNEWVYTMGWHGMGMVVFFEPMDEES
jgi:hypothetical protein